MHFKCIHGYAIKYFFVWGHDQVIIHYKLNTTKVLLISCAIISLSDLTLISYFGLVRA